MSKWTLHDKPFRHYKVVGPKGKPTWEGKDRQRIVSVTTVLDGDEALPRWAASTALGAAETAARAYFHGVDEALDTSILSFGQLVETTGMMPDAVKDLAGDEGTAAHVYLAQRLRAWSGVESSLLGLPARGLPEVPYGVMVAIDGFLAEHEPEPVIDAQGPRVERIVGDYDTAVAGTYDAQVLMGSDASGWWPEVGDAPTHRIDLKSSRTMQPKFFAQLAEYERLAVGNGEDPSDYLTVLHVDRAGNFQLYSIEVGSAQHKQALQLFDANLAIHRLTPKLAKILKG